MIPLEALRSREGAAYVGAAVVLSIIAALLAVNTLVRYLHEEELREAFGAASREEGTAANLLSKLRGSDPRDVDVRVVLGCVESERGEEDAARLEVADKLFAEALALDPTREAALVGQVANRLRMAMAGTPEGRGAAIDQANELLKSVPDGPDREVLEAAVMILRGHPADALKKLDAPIEGPISLSALRGWTWNRAVAAILAHDGRALELTLPAFVMRPQQVPGEWTRVSDGPPEFTGPRTDASRVLAAAYRVTLVGAPGGPDVMPARCDLARRALAPRFDAGGVLPGRFHPGGRDLGAGWNALGIALLRMGKVEEAAEAFRQASSLSTEPAYDFAYADALYRKGLALAEDDAERYKSFLSAAEVYNNTYGVLKRQNKPERAATRAFAATNSAVIMWLAGSPQEGARQLAAVDDKDFSDLGRRYRNLAALYDLGNLGREALATYKKAIELGGPDAGKMQVRLRILETRFRR